MTERLHFALFGNPVSQSLSPAMHAAAFGRMGIAADYAAYRELHRAELVRYISDVWLARPAAPATTGAVSPQPRN